jgi:replicative DNA helicase
MTRHHPPKASPQPIDVLMASGAIKPLNAIEIGDEIMGADSLPRTVIDIRTSLEDSFEIRPINPDIS